MTSDIKYRLDMRTLKIILMTLIVILTHQSINAQIINAQLHNRFINIFNITEG